MDTEGAPALKVIHYEPAERARIRRKLLRYMEENRIGVPKLQLLIVRANGYRADQIDFVSLKTLQRFLADKHRTNDTFITLCARFAEDLPDEDPIGDLGAALTTFMRGKVDEAGPLAFPEHVLGAYDATLETTPAVPVGPYSRLTVDRVVGTTFASVSEMVGSVRPEGDRPTSEGSWRVYEGVMFKPSVRFFALMRNALTGAPRTYDFAYMRVMNKDRIGTLRGFGTDGDDLPEKGQPAPITATFWKIAEDATP